MRISLPQNTFLVLVGAVVAHGAAAAVPQPPIPHAHGRAQPRIVPSGRAVLFTGHTGTTSPWQAIANAPSFNPGAMLLLTDGTLLVQDQGVNNGGTNAWWKLTPDITGSYVNGTWSQVASLIAKYQPLYFADAVLPDGRVIIEGGEYNLGKEVWTNQGAIYDPVANSWTPVKPPKGSEWSRIGDGPGTVLANGTFMLGASGYSGTTAEALLTESSLKWKATGSGKADGNGEEGWSLLPNGDVLTVDTNDGTNTEIYSPATKAWTSAGGTPSSLINGGEVGPQVLQPDGTVFAVGATGANAVYASGTGTWAAAPSFPVIGGAQYDVADGASAVLPDGNVLVDASPGVYQTPVHFWEFDGTNLTQVADTPNAPNLSSFDGFMIVLPTGQVMFNDRVGSIEFYTSTGAPKAAWLPVITSVPATLTHGSSYTVSGKQLGGLTQAAAYGDDYQAATNYPLVRLTVTATSHVFYARTSGFTAMGVAPAAKSSASFLVPAGIETGAATLQVVANGIASKPVSVTID